MNGMTVAQFIEWLKTQDQEAVVHIPGTVQRYGDHVGKWREFTDPVDQAYYMDFRGNQFAKPDHPCFGKRILELGELA
jgi:hypothetical protein